mgnify:CR=1 FL=1
MSDIELYKRALAREKQARQEAEQLLEDSTRRLYQKNQALEKSKALLVQQQSAMLKNEKLATIGMLSAGVAHEINNPLSVVMGNLNSLAEYNEHLLQLITLVTDWKAKQQLPASLLAQFEQLAKEADLEFIAEDCPDMVSDMQEGLERVRDIVSNMKAFSRTKPGERELSDINDCIRSSIKLVNNNIKDQCEVRTAFGDLPKTMANASELCQVFMNMLINSAHAMPEPGLIKVTTRLKQDRIYIEILDNGCGMPEEVIKDIYNPFFTTKPPGQGTGMGLSVAMGIIEDHQGQIDVMSKVGNGTCFTVCLPVIESNAAEKSAIS